MSRILAIDYGTKRTGLAVSDPSRIIAGGLDTVATAELEAWLAKYMAAEKVSVIVLGRPMQTTGAPSATYDAVVKLAERLQVKYPDVKVVLFDERYTSLLAQRAMIDGGMKKMQRRDKAVVDKISATIILQGFMESRIYNEEINHE